MDNSTFALLVVAILTVGTFLLLPRVYRHYAILLPLLILLLLAILNLFVVFGFSFKLLFIILAGLIVVVSSTVVRIRP